MKNPPWGIEGLVETQKAERNFDSGVPFEVSKAGEQVRIGGTVAVGASW